MKRNNCLGIVLLFVCVLLILCMAGGVPPCVAQEDVSAPGPTRSDTVGTQDPFMPFIDIVEKEPAGRRVEEELKTAEERKQYPPLERYGVEEFLLVGIIWNQEQQVAVVEDSQGKYHTLQKGTKIGVKEGVVEQILPDQVIILEKVKDAFNNITVERAVLKLRSEEEGES